MNSNDCPEECGDHDGHRPDCDATFLVFAEIESMLQIALGRQGTDISIGTPLANLIAGTKLYIVNLTACPHKSCCRMFTRRHQCICVHLLRPTIHNFGVDSTELFPKPTVEEQDLIETVEDYYILKERYCQHLKKYMAHLVRAHLEQVAIQ